MAETKTISVKIDHKLYTALKTRAELDNSNVSDEIRSLLRSALAAVELDLYGNEVAGFIRCVVDARMDVAALDIERKLDARLSQLQDVRHAPLGEITLIHSPALRLFWIDTALTAPDYSALELSTSRLAAAQAEAHYDPKIAQVMSYINENLCGELNVDVLAERVFLSKYHFMRLFKAQTGVTVHTYVRQKRLVNAARLIREGTPAAKAAADSGFTDYSAFHRAFRESFGMSPGKLKK